MRLCSIRGLLSLSWDVETNPGLIIEDKCKGLLQNQKEILSKLALVQQKKDSFETRFVDMQNRLHVIETKVESLVETWNSLATLETIVAGRSIETASLIKHVHDLDNRQNNLIITGIVEDENEKEETLVSKAKYAIFCAIRKVNVTSIERVHRLCKKLSGRTSSVILRLADYRGKMNALPNF